MVVKNNSYYRFMKQLSSTCNLLKGRSPTRQPSEGTHPEINFQSLNLPQAVNIYPNMIRQQRIANNNKKFYITSLANYQSHQQKEASVTNKAREYR